MNINRGDIFYVDYLPTVGSEQRGGRPAVVVSNNKNNENSGTIEVVYLTTQPKADLPTHVIVRGTGTKSTALCEQIHTISVDRLGDFNGVCTTDEMQMIDLALAVSLGIQSEAEQERAVPDNTNQYASWLEVPYNGQKHKFTACDISALMARFEVYKELYNLGKMSPAL